MSPAEISRRHKSGKGHREHRLAEAITLTQDICSEAPLASGPHRVGRNKLIQDDPIAPVKDHPEANINSSSQSEHELVDYNDIDDVIWEGEQQLIDSPTQENCTLIDNPHYGIISREVTSQACIHGDSAGITEQTLKNVSREVAKQRKNSWPRLTPAASKIKELQVYESCRVAATHNLMGPRVSLPSGIKIEAWKKYSTGHTDDYWLLQCIEYGYPMQYRGPALYSDISDNHSSATNFSAHVQKYIQKESGFGGLIGPFEQPPFQPWCHVAPLMTRPKTGTQERRIIVDLSYPRSSNPNMHIEKNVVFGQSQVHVLPTINDVTRIVTSCGFDLVLRSLDIARAYRNFRLDPYDWPLSCIQVEGKFFIDICMPFGSRLSSLYMQKMSNMITRALADMGVNCLIYLDDALVICPKGRDPERDFNTALSIVREMGLPLAWEKLISPAPVIRFLGVIIDVKQREIRIPKDKCDSFLELITEISDRRWISKRTLQQVIGHINHIGKGVQAARLFMNRLLCELRSCESGIYMDENIRRDLMWFQRFLHQFNGRAMILDELPTRVIEADSCLSGGGAMMGSHCYSYIYPPDVAEKRCISHNWKHGIA